VRQLVLGEAFTKRSLSKRRGRSAEHAGHEIATYFSILDFFLWQAAARSFVYTFRWQCGFTTDRTLNSLNSTNCSDELFFLHLF